MTRAERTEITHRYALRRALEGVLEILNPEDRINWPQKYPEFLVYAHDFLTTELNQVTGVESPPNKKPAPAGSLDI